MAVVEIGVADRVEDDIGAFAAGQLAHPFRNVRYGG
jgi:hypothetical protein